MIDFLGKTSLRSKSASRIGKYLLIKLLIFGKIGLYDVTLLKDQFLKRCCGFFVHYHEKFEKCFKTV